MEAGSPQNQGTVLVVEDDILVRMPIAQYLRHCGYLVIEAANADEAMTILLHRDTGVDVVSPTLTCLGQLTASDWQDGYVSIVLGWTYFLLGLCRALSRARNNFALMGRYPSLTTHKPCIAYPPPARGLKDETVSGTSAFGLLTAGYIAQNPWRGLW